MYQLIEGRLLSLSRFAFCGAESTISCVTSFRITSGDMKVTRKMSKRTLALLRWNRLPLTGECRAISYSVRSYFKSKSNSNGIDENRSLDIAKPPHISPVENAKFSGVIPTDKLTVTYSASTGPGGQNVNKVHTKVDMRFQVNDADWIPEILKPRILETYKNVVNKEGWLVLKSDKTRSQMLNVADCLDKLRVMIRAVQVEEIKPPSQEDIYLRLKRQERATRERLKVKRIQSLMKQSRGASD